MVAADLDALIVRAQGGDREAFEEAFRPLYDDAFRLAIAMLQDRAEAEDALQEALLKAWRKLHTFRVGTGLRPWFLTVVANQCRSIRRTRWWSVQRLAVIEISHPGPSQEPERLDLRRALSLMPAAQRLLLVLHYYLDMSFEEMAQVVGGRPEAVKSRTYRALRKLRTSVLAEPVPEAVG
ncbi:MAG: RNA polymerase [Candidatus Nephthysia bennettiae]|nr:MAG: RNA polymerase [Candidatus Dormibacteraeota bacterium]